MTVLYFSPYGGKVFSVLAEEDPAFERRMDREGREFDKLAVHESHEQLGPQIDRLYVVGGKVEVR